MPKIIGTIRHFEGLLNTPNSFSGANGKGLVVNISESGLDFYDINAATGLEQVTENSNTGLRRIGVDPAFYGDIGRGAVDFSTSDAPSSTMGSTGFDSFTIGYLNITSGYAGITYGQNNSNAGDHNLISGDTNIALINSYAGLILGFDNTTDGVYNRAYGSGNITGGGWSAVADGFENQALENYAYARGFKNIARGYGSNSIGLFCDVNSIRTAFAFGDSCVTTADGSFLSGIALDAGDSFGVMVTGTANVSFTGSGAGDRYNPIDPIFVVGNGTYNTPNGAPWTGSVRSNALFLDKGGRLFLPSVNNAMIDGATGDVVPTKDWVQAQAGGGTLQQVLDTGNSSTTELMITDGTVTSTLWSDEFRMNNLTGFQSTITTDGFKVQGNGEETQNNVGHIISKTFADNFTFRINTLPVPMTVNTVIDFRPDLSGTVAYLSDIGGGGPAVKGTVDCGDMGADSGARPITGSTILTASKNAGTNFHYLTITFAAFANTNYMVQVSLECVTAANRLWHPTIFSKSTTSAVIAIGQDPTVNALGIIAAITITSLD